MTRSRYPGVVHPVAESFAASAARSRGLPSPLLSQRAVRDELEQEQAPRLTAVPRNAAVLAQNAPFSPTTLSPAPDLQFDTNAFSNLNRPDSAIAAGPFDLVTAVNFKFQVQDLNGGNVVVTDVSAFFPDDPTQSIGDPHLSYDQASGRFIMSWLGFDYPKQKGPNDTGDSFCDVAVSATSDPRGTWFKYTFHVLRGTEQMDFDSLGYDGTAIYVSARTRDFANNIAVSGNRTLILDKAKALAGQPLTPVIVDNLALPGGGLAEVIKPVEPAEPVTPTSPAYFLAAQGNNAIALYTLTDPLGTPTFSAVQIPIPAWAPAGLAVQPGGPPALAQEAGFPLHKTMIRNGVIWSCQSPSATGVAGDRAGIVLYKIDPVAGTLLESHTVSDPSLSYYLPAVVPDISGNAVVAFAGSDATHFPSLYYARYAAALGDFEAPVVATAGATAFEDTTDSEEAWGDYTDAAPDVASGGREVWIHGELPATTTTWKMRAARIPSTPRPIAGVSSTSLQYGTLCPGVTANQTLTVSNTGTADLHVSGIARISGSAQFGLFAGPAFPTTIAPGGHADYVIQFATTLPGGPAAAVFRVSSDDPLTPTIDVSVGGTVDGPPPVLGASPALTVETCSDALTAVTLTPPTVSDACNLPVTPVGSVISSVPPIPVVGGQVSLPPGTHTIQWTANDGLHTSTSTQTIVVQPGIMASGKFLLQDRARVQTVANALAGVGNAGAIITQIGNDVALGDILSVAPVVLLDRVTVQGAIHSGGSITLGHSDVVGNPVVSFTTVALPPVPNLAGVVFPPPTGGSPTFNPTNPPGQTVPLAPGSYGVVNINSGARVALSAGSYFFQQLLINAASSTLVIPSAGVVRIFVASQLAYRGQVINPNGQPGQIFLGYNGTGPASLESSFVGTLVAPHGQVKLGTTMGQVFRGRFFGQDLEVQPDIHLTCDTSVTAQ